MLNDVIIRDKQDSTRAIDPLRAAEDAVTLDTSHLTQREVEEKILLLLHETLDKQAKKREPLTLFYRVAMWVSTFLFHVLYPVRYHDIENAQIDAPYILVGNHSHFLDPLLVGWKINRYQIRYLGKKELIKHPLMKGLYRNMLMIPVDRHNMDMGALRACLKTLKEGHVLGIFPEGTRYKKNIDGRDGKWRCGNCTARRRSDFAGLCSHQAKTVPSNGLLLRQAFYRNRNCPEGANARNV